MNFMCYCPWLNSIRFNLHLNLQYQGIYNKISIVLVCINDKGVSYRNPPLISNNRGGGHTIFKEQCS